MQKLLTIMGAALLLGACAQKSAYEAAVEDYEPVYCYKSLGGVTCYEKPNFRDERRMVNYFGPAPKRYERPEPAPEPQPQLFAPEPVSYWVKDPEPLPRPAPKGDLADRPWFTADQQAAVVPESAMRPLHPLPAEDGRATEAFLKRMEEAAGPEGDEIE